MATISRTMRPEALMRRFEDRSYEKRIPREERETWLLDLGWGIGGLGPKGIRFLLSSIASADEHRLRAILLGSHANAEHLPAPLRHQVCETALAFLSDSRPILIAEAVDALTALGQKGARDRVQSLLEHPNPYVIGAALRYLARLFPKKALPILEEALTSPQQIVRQNAIDELDDLEYLPALPRIRKLLKDPNKWVRQAARWAVKNLEDLQNDPKE